MYDKTPFVLVMLGTDTVFTPDNENYKLRFLSEYPEPLKSNEISKDRVIEIFIKSEREIVYKLVNDPRQSIGHIYSTANQSNSSPLANSMSIAARTKFNFLRNIYLTPPEGGFTEQFVNESLIEILNIAKSKRPVLSINYPRGETLSIISKFISDENLFISDGPDTLGLNVGVLIAQALMKMLFEVSERRTAFVFLSHSRGAVQSIVAAHEFQRVLNNLKSSNEPLTYDSLIKIIECRHTRSCLQANSSYKALFNSILKKIDRKPEFIDSINVNIFAVDPVPGNAPGYLPNFVNYISWDNSDFAKLPPIVNNYTQIFMDDERSVCFRTIVSDNLNKDYQRIIRMPGNHGTFSGNPYAQASSAISDPSSPRRQNKTQIQDIGLYMLIDFLEANKVSFVDPIELLNNEIFNLVNSYIKMNPANRLKMKVAKYRGIFKDRESYKEFRKTHYSLGVESLQSDHDNEDRCVRYKNKVVSSSFALVDNHTHGYVNSHHQETEAAYKQLAATITQQFLREQYARYTVEEKSQKQISNRKKDESATILQQVLREQSARHQVREKSDIYNAKKNESTAESGAKGEIIITYTCYPQFTVALKGSALSDTDLNEFICIYNSVERKINSHDFIHRFIEKYNNSKNVLAWNSNFNKALGLSANASIKQQVFKVFQHARDMPDGRTSKVLQELLNDLHNSQKQFPEESGLPCRHGRL